MNKPNFLVLIVLLVQFGCYNPELDTTDNNEFDFELLGDDSQIIADGFAKYRFRLSVPGIRNGEDKILSLNSTWGKWSNGLSSIDFPIRYDKKTNTFSDTIILTAGRNIGSFLIEIKESDKSLERANLNSVPKFPEKVQIISDSATMNLVPGNKANIVTFFYNSAGFHSYGTKFRLRSDKKITIFPSEILVDSTEVNATIQVNSDSEEGLLKIFAEFPESINQPEIDTLKINLKQ